LFYGDIRLVRREFELEGTLFFFSSVCRIGKKSARLVRMAATRLAVELLGMIQRPAHAVITKTLEGYNSINYLHFNH
jgi:hypothetical protein